MKEIIDNLKGKEIIYEHSIEVLKNYIAQKYPSESEGYRARVFADAIHKIIDDHIREFRRDDQKAIKRSLLTNAVDNNSFEINAYDIMKTCVELEINEETFLDDLNSWLNHQQEIPIQREAIREITHIVEEEIRAEREALEAMTAQPITEAVAAVEEPEPSIKAPEPVFDEPEPVIEESEPLVEEEVEAYMPDDEYGVDTTKVEVSTSFEDDLMAQLEAAFAEVEDTEPTVYETVVYNNNGKEEEHIDNEDIDALFEDVITSEVINEEPELEVIEEETYTETIEKDYVDATEDSFAAMSDEDEDFLPEEPIVVSIPTKTKTPTSSEAPDWNMFNLADVMYNESEGSEEGDEAAEAVADVLEDRPVIKVEMERQMDRLTEQEKVEVPPEKTLSLKERYEDWIQTGRYKEDIKTAIPIVLGFIALVIVLYYIVNNVQLTPTEEVPATPTEQSDLIETMDVAMTSLSDTAIEEETIEVIADPMDLHPSLRYKEIDKEALQVWLDRNNSMLAEEGYFNTMLEVAEAYGVNPLLLFAITGQEQGFVKRDHPDALEMINNPFNVLGSWQSYNTNLSDSASIASRSIHTLSAGLPEGEDPIMWINYGGNTDTIGYAEDRNWHKGVTAILNQLEAEAGH